MSIFRTNVASVGSVFNDTRKEKSTFRATALRRELVVGLLTPDEGPSLETSIFPLSFQVVREPLPFAYPEYFISYSYSEYFSHIVNLPEFCIYRYKGVKEASMVQNAAYFIFTQADDGSFEAYPVDSQYRFTPVINYRTLTADEAEEEYSARNKTINLFSLMVKKRLTDTEEKPGEEEIAIPKVKSKVDKLVRYSCDISN